MKWRTFTLCLPLLTLPVPPSSAAAQTPAEPTAPARTAQQEVTTAAETAMPRYTSLAELVMRVCEEAAATFQGFFSPSLVRVAPFAFYDGNFDRSTALGMTFADQMTAAINGTANAAYNPEISADQELSGILQEMDGYLRVHISATNSLGERRSHVVAVEMSEPVYRALHSGSW